MMSEQKHTKGAIRAAEIITGGAYGSDKRYPTDYGAKTVEGIADLIDLQTMPHDLTRALQSRVNECHCHNIGHGPDGQHWQPCFRCDSDLAIIRQTKP